MHLCKAIARISTLILRVSVVGRNRCDYITIDRDAHVRGIVTPRACVCTRISVCEAGRTAGIAKAPGRTSINTGLSLLVWVLSGQGVSPGKQPSEPAVSNVTVCCKSGSASFSFSFPASSTSYFYLSLLFRFPSFFLRFLAYYSILDTLCYRGSIIF